MLHRQRSRDRQRLGRGARLPEKLGIIVPKPKGRKAMTPAMTGKRSVFTTVSIAALSISLGGALAAHRDQRAAAHVHSHVERIISAVPGAITLYDQNSDPDFMFALKGQD